MTRFLVLGSSHVAAMKQAAPQFVERHPDIDLSFFASAAPTFRVGRVGQKGFFTPKYRSKGDRQLARQVNDALTVDLTSFDQILVSGFRFSMGDVAKVLLDFDIVEGTDTGKAQTCSLDFLRAMIDHLVAREMKLITGCLGENRNFTITDAPYPAETIGQRSEDYDPAKSLDAFMNHPDAPGLFDYWKDQVAAGVTAAGYGFLPQPVETVTKPFATAGQFTAAAPHMNGEQLSWTDHRHMNADFGLHVLEAFTEKHMNPTPKPA
ncbi:hypothetical protein [Falsiphaeobacter marinintestinus]|uniref:hypothetical protein n=1 Tax=Falsiphaeobacter marinintestinus TaxID=1492905 RepID=UPI0011B691B1|nr:hypothetical protein [Phaeobacter marinintestinus]